ncbi:hypothetical protein L1987_23373 [Smallanthus sonchifolius]|uniref:Uncharacterized protein n=1 Tax=Smallanthus sonchifolius TaxID=185202 RepID=A0ACB9IIX0_9ASTR|nr:hypothetical protein L1987_23373 [Smallanthus sonchifolius]
MNALISSGIDFCGKNVLVLKDKKVLNSRGGRSSVSLILCLALVRREVKCKLDMVLTFDNRKVYDEIKVTTLKISAQRYQGDEGPSWNTFYMKNSVEMRHQNILDVFPEARRQIAEACEQADFMFVHDKCDAVGDRMRNSMETSVALHELLEISSKGKKQCTYG